MIYVISAGPEYVKIGVSKTLQRISDLQCGCPLPLAYLALADWPNKDERRIHRVLRSIHVRGEWFRREALIDSLIKHMHAGDTNANAWLSTLSAPARLARVLRLAR